MKWICWNSVDFAGKRLDLLADPKLPACSSFWPWLSTLKNLNHPYSKHGISDMTLEKHWKYQCFALRVLTVKTHSITVWAESCPGCFSQWPRRRVETGGGM